MLSVKNIGRVMLFLTNTSDKSMTFLLSGAHQPLGA